MAYGSKKGLPELVSFDIGNGYVKYRSRFREGSYLSAIGQVSRTLDGFSGLKGPASNIVSFEGEMLAFGDNIHLNAEFVEIIHDSSRIDDPYYRKLFATALSASIGVPKSKRAFPVEVILSLPPMDYIYRKDSLKKNMSGDYRIGSMVNGEMIEAVYRVSEDSIRVIPEGFGAICFYVLDDSERKIAGLNPDVQVVGVVDVGTRTTDFVQLDSLRIVQSGCDSVEDAIGSIIYRQLISHAASMGVRIKDYECQRIIDQGYFLKGGSHIDISTDLDGWKDSLASVIRSHIRHIWRGGDSVEKILLTGGGAQYVDYALRKNFGHAYLASENKNILHLGNASGGFLYGMLRRENA